MGCEVHSLKSWICLKLNEAFIIADQIIVFIV